MDRPSRRPGQPFRPSVPRGAAAGAAAVEPRHRRSGQGRGLFARRDHAGRPLPHQGDQQFKEEFLPYSNTTTTQGGGGRSMTVELWIGREFDHTHEIQALKRLYTQMLESYGQGEDFFFLFANFFCQSEEIDLAVVKRNGIAVIELKEVGGTISGHENGPWTEIKRDGSSRRINDGRRRNPFQQMRAYRYAMISQLKKDSLGFLPPRKAELMRLDHVSALLTLCPNKDSDVVLDFRPPKWFDIVGLNELAQAIYLLRSSSLSFLYSEIASLAEMWKLYQPAPGMFSNHLVVGSRNSTAASLPLERSYLTTSTTRTHEHEGVIANRTSVAEIDSCIMCQYANEVCDLPYLHGTIYNVSEDHSEPPVTRLHVVTHERELIHLYIRSHSLDDMMPALESSLRQELADGRSNGIAIAAFHLMRLNEKEYSVDANGLVVLEPEWLIDVTDLTKIEYCPRQYLVDRFRLRSVSHPIVRGNIIHRCFEQIIRTPLDDAAITQALKNAFHEQVMDLAILNQTKQSTWQEVRSHYQMLKDWAIDENTLGSVQSEVFLLTPRLGIKGKIDAVWWLASDHLSDICELKTSKSYGQKPRPGHALQAGAYSIMTQLRGWGSPSNQTVWLLYSGNNRLANSLNIKRHVQLSAATLQEVVKQRNLLVMADYVIDAPFEVKNLNKCRKCSVAGECKSIALVLDHLDPRPPEIKNIAGLHNEFDDVEKTWFQTYARLLAQEYRAVKESHAALWQQPPEERLASGTTIVVAGIRGGSASELNGRYIYDLLSDVKSELREDDVVLVSSAEGPANGLIAQGSVRRPLEDGLSVEFQRPLGFEPVYVDRYVTESLVERQFAGPYSWLSLPKEHRDLVIKRRKPMFEAAQLGLPLATDVGPHKLNDRQNFAVQLALEMQDYVIVQGPPGSGKTMMIVALVREFLKRGQRVLLAAGTNTAVDNMLIPLHAAGLGAQMLRLGSERRTHRTVREYIPEIVAQNDDLDSYIHELRFILETRPVVAATATTWLSGTWGLLPQFDVAIIDEAAQLTLPASLGPLRLASKFVLIGDHMQLPAVVTSEGRASRDSLDHETSPRLSESLFEALYRDLDTSNQKGLVKLNEQYRMNEDICAIPRLLGWYDELAPANDKVASAKLTLITRFPEEHPLIEILHPDRSVVFVDVPWNYYGGAARTNQKEAEMVSTIIRTHLKHGLSIASIGVIAPFRAQVALIRRLLESGLPKDLHVAIRGGVDTVDRFQGQERELIVLSLATHANHVHDLLFDERRLNVALTRAKQKLIILGDAAVLRKSAIYSRLIDLCTFVQIAL